MVGQKEKATSKTRRLCHYCMKMDFHDKRTCPMRKQKNQTNGEEDDDEDTP